MKKLISLFLILTLLTGILPLNAFAAEDTFTLSQEEYDRALRKAGMEAGAWHEGMSWSDSMSAYQKFCWLSDFRDNVVTPARRRYNMALDQADADPSLKTETDAYSLGNIGSVLYVLENKLNYFIFDLETEVNAISNSRSLISDPAASVSDKAATYRRVSAASSRITDLGKELKEGPFPAAWQDQTNDIGKQLDAFFAAADTGAKNNGTLNSLAVNDGTSFDIIILDMSEIGIDVKDSNYKPIADAKVTITAGKTVLTGYTGSNGVVIFPAGAFELDLYNRMYAAIVIEKKGYRIWESQSIRVTAGDGVHALLEQDNGESYVQWATFRGVDIAHDTEQVYYTPENDADQSFKVGVHTYPGKPCTFTLTYTPVNASSPKTITRTVNGTTEGITVLDLTDKWCSVLAPEETVTLACSRDGGPVTFSRTSGITTSKAVVDLPKKEITGIPSYVPGTSFDLDIPLNLPGLKNLRFSMAAPWELLGIPAVHFAVTPEGNFTLSIAVASANKYIDGVSKSEWKTVNSKETMEKWSDFITGEEKLADIAMGTTRRDGARQQTMSLLKSKIMASFCVLLSGKFTENKNALRTEDRYNGSLDLFFSAALDAMISFNSPFMAGPVPCYVGFDLSFGLQAGVDLPFTFTSGSTGITSFSEWHNIRFGSEDLDIIISPRVSLAAFAGAGVKGLAGIYLRGYAGLSVNLHIRPMNSQSKFTPEITLNAGLQIVAEFLFWSVKATIWDRSWRYPSKNASQNGIMLSAGNGLTGGDDDVHYTEAQVSDLSMVTGATNYRTVKLGDDFYAFWIADKVVEGVSRPWLNCAKITAGNGSVTSSPMDLPYLYVTHETSPTRQRKIDELVKVVDFDVTTTDELTVREGDLDMITLAVTFEKYRTVREFPNRRFEITGYTTDFYCIVFFGNGSVQQYSTKGSGFTDETVDSMPTGTVVSIAYDHQEGTESGRQGGEHADFYYKLMCATTFQSNPTKVFGGEATVALTPGRPADVMRDYGFATRGISYYTLDFNTAQSPIEELVQVFPVAGGAGRGDHNLVYALARLKGAEGESDSGKTAFLVADTEGKNRQTILEGNIASFRYIPGFGSGTGLFAVADDPDDAGRCCLEVMEYTLDSSSLPVFAEPRDLGIRISPAGYDLVDLGASRALYYLESVSTDANSYKEAGYNIRAVYLATGSDENIYASRPFHLASFRSSDVSTDNGISFIRLYPDDTGFIQGFLTEKVKTGETFVERLADGTTIKYKDSKTQQVKYFTFRQTLQAEVLDATPEQTLVQPGDTVNVLFSLMNTGNIPASKVELRAYAQMNGSPMQIPLAVISVNCQDPLGSKVVQDGMPELTGYAAVSPYDSVSDSDMNTFAVSESGVTDVYATNVLMPDDTRSYRAGFSVPRDFTPGEYRIYVTFRSMSTLVTVQSSRLDAVSAWAKTLNNEDAPLLGAGRPINPTGLHTLTMTMSEPLSTNSGANDGMMITSYMLDNTQGSGITMTGKEAVSAFATRVYNDTNEIPVGDADLAVTGRLSLEAGVETVHVTIRNLGTAEAKDIRVSAAVDTAGTWQKDLAGLTLRYNKTASFDIPLSEITNGKTGDDLILKVSGISDETNLENNEAVLPLNLGFLIVKHPEDVFTSASGSAEFSVAARGGKQPYSYQWQVSKIGQNGPFGNIEGATEQTLKLSNIPAGNNGYYYRVIVRDADGNTLTSNPALLVVNRPPLTGDSAMPLMWSILLIASLTAAAVIIRRRKRS
ncbi:MAG: carboxypeptidase-like regulatory domain-containing protein [Clostridia bacterium]|nr:carboxypeptidase-like regulatory domain-containing protein [Clostridia bacterium]